MCAHRGTPQRTTLAMTEFSSSQIWLLSVVNWLLPFLSQFQSFSVIFSQFSKQHKEGFLRADTCSFVKVLGLACVFECFRHIVFTSGSSEIFFRKGGGDTRVPDLPESMSTFFKCQIEQRECFKTVVLPSDVPNLMVSTWIDAFPTSKSVHPTPKIRGKMTENDWKWLLKVVKWLLLPIRWLKVVIWPGLLCDDPRASESQIHPQKNAFFTTRAAVATKDVAYKSLCQELTFI